MIYESTRTEALEIESWIAHRPPFRWVDTLVDLQDDGGSFVLRLAPEQPRMQHGLHPSLVLLEALAQSTAAFWGAQAAGRGETTSTVSSVPSAAPSANPSPTNVESGVIVAIDDAMLVASPRPHDEIILTVRRTHMLGPLVRFSGEARRGETLLCRADLSVRRAIDATAAPP